MTKMNFEKSNFGSLVKFPSDIVWKKEGEKNVLILFCFFLHTFHLAHGY